MTRTFSFTPATAAARYKQARAVDVLDRLARAGTGTIRPHVLAEFFVAATRRIVPPLSLKVSRSCRVPAGASRATSFSDAAGARALWR